MTKYLGLFFLRIGIIELGEANKLVSNKSTSKIKDLTLASSSNTGWTVGSKPVGRNDIFPVRPEYYE